MICYIILDAPRNRRVNNNVIAIMNSSCEIQFQSLESHLLCNRNGHQRDQRHLHPRRVRKCQHTLPFLRLTQQYWFGRIKRQLFLVACLLESFDQIIWVRQCILAFPRRFVDWIPELLSVEMRNTRQNNAPIPFDKIQYFDTTINGIPQLPTRDACHKVLSGRNLVLAIGTAAGLFVFCFV